MNCIYNPVVICLGLVFSSAAFQTNSSNISHCVLEPNYFSNISKFGVDLKSNEEVISNSSNTTKEPEKVNYMHYALNPGKLFEWAEPEREFYQQIKKLWHSEMVNSTCKEALFSYIMDYDEGHVTNDQNALMENPLIIFKMIWRLAVKYPEIRNSCHSTTIPDEVSEVVEFLEVSGKALNISLPIKMDMRQAVSGIIRLQSVYQMDVRSLSQGIIGSIETGVLLNYENCWEISRIVASRPEKAGEIHFAIEWLEIARDLAFQCCENNSAISELDAETQKLHEKHDEILEKNGNDTYYQFELFAHKLVNNSLNSTDFRKEKYSRREKEVNILREKARRNQSADEIPKHLVSTLNSWDLCAETWNFQTEFAKSRLSCYLSRKSHPYFLINPLQVEILNEDPVLIQIYNFIGDKTVNEILENAKPTLSRSEEKIRNETTNETKTDFTPGRTSINTWAPNKATYLESIYKKMEFLMGLNISGNSSEELQVAQYSALGSHYTVHTDEYGDQLVPVDGKLKIRGRRLSTFMFYLNNVEFGGNTAFPLMGVAAKPVKNSVVFWYNLHPNTTTEFADEKTEHSGCPVAFGRKDIATKWIHDLPNMFNRKCPLDQHATNNFKLLREFYGLLK